jgi:hypothetical protein
MSAYDHMDLITEAWSLVDAQDKNLWNKFYQFNKRKDMGWADSWVVCEALIAVKWGLTD